MGASNGSFEHEHRMGASITNGLLINTERPFMPHNSARGACRRAYVGGMVPPQKEQSTMWSCQPLVLRLILQPSVRVEVSRKPSPSGSRVVGAGRSCRSFLFSSEAMGSMSIVPAKLAEWLAYFSIVPSSPHLVSPSSSTLFPIHLSSLHFRHPSSLQSLPAILSVWPGVDRDGRISS
jgi:hypothetical protein